MNQYKKFETERLILKPTSEEDAEFIFELFNTPKWIKYIGDRNIKTLEDAKNYIIGTNIKVGNTDPETAQILTNSLGSFLKYLIITDKISKFVNSEYTLSKIQIKSTNSTLLDFSFEMKQLVLKKKRLEEIQKKYPEVGKFS